MKRTRKIIEYTLRILILGILAVALIFIFGSLRPQSPLTPQPITSTVNSVYPAPQGTGMAKLAATSSPTVLSAYPPPERTLIPTTPVGTPRDPNVPVTITPVPITPYPTLTLQPGPSPTLIPLIGPAKDNNGDVFFIAKESKDTKSKVHSFSTDGKGKVLKQAMKLSDAEAPVNSNVFPSPDGNLLAIKGDWGQLTIYDLNKGAVLKQISLGGSGKFFNWFPDSRQILVGSGSLILFDIISEEFTHLVVSGYGSVTAAAASPDGRYVVYAYSTNIIYEKGLWVINTNGQNAHLLVKDVDPLNISWSPDGKKIVFGNSLQVVNADGTDLRELASEGNLANPKCNLIPPKWSPDSKMLAMVTTKTDAFCNGWGNDNFNGTEIVLIDVASGKAHPLLNDKSMGNIDPTWSPDGTQIAFVSNRGGTPEIWAVNADGSNLRQITKNNYLSRFPFWKKIAQ